MEAEPDFTGWATKANIRCSDGRTIMPDAFKHQDGVKVPLVWRHGSDDPTNVLGYAILRHAEGEGMRTEAFFNGTPKAQHTKAAIEHGDLDSLSIWANKLTEKAKQVFHGMINEVSVCLMGANPEAKIDYVRIAHSDGLGNTDYEVLDDEAIITMGLELEHADSDDSDDDETVGDILGTLNEKQRDVVNYLLEEAAKGSVEHEDGDDDEEEDDSENEDVEHDDNDKDEDILEHQEGTDMTGNVFDRANKSDGTDTITITGEKLNEFKHDVFDSYKKGGSFKDAVLAHAADYGITNVETLFPEAKNVNGKPEWITRKMPWVETVLGGAQKLPFARFKSRSADLTHEEARAKGYIKGNVKKEQFFAIAQRETGPTTIYKKQKMDRDDIIDITEFDVIAWLWQEMRFMLREEIARAILIGDGRPVEDPANPGQPNPDKIPENKIRPVAKDDDFYTHKVTVPSNTSPEQFIEAVLRARKYYKGVGNPTLFTTEDMLTDMLLVKDGFKRRLYPTEAELRSALRVSNIETVDVMEGQTDEDGNGLLGILLNMSDYSIGTDQGGQITTFQQFDIDVNQEKLLIEGRMSGALTRHKTAMAVYRASGTVVTPQAPTFDSETNVITIPSQAGVVYSIDGDPVTGTVTITEDTMVEAAPASGYSFTPGVTVDWAFTFNTNA